MFPLSPFPFEKQIDLVIIDSTTKGSSSTDYIFAIAAERLSQIENALNKQYSFKKYFVVVENAIHQKNFQEALEECYPEWQSKTNYCHSKEILIQKIQELYKEKVSFTVLCEPCQEEEYQVVANKLSRYEFLGFSHFPLSEAQTNDIEELRQQDLMELPQDLDHVELEIFKLTGNIERVKKAFLS